MKHKAQIFYEKEWNNEKFFSHSKAVVEACIGISNNTDLNQDLLIVAGWIHDLGKSTEEFKQEKEDIKKGLIKDDNHNELSLKFLNKFIEQNQEYKQFEKELKDAVLNHRTNSKPETIYGEIMKVADKVALLNKNWIEFKKNNEKKV